MLLLLPSYKLHRIHICRVSTCVYIYVKYVQVPFLLHESHVEYCTTLLITTGYILTTATRRSTVLL